MYADTCCSRGIYVGSKPQPKVDETYVVFNVLRRFDDPKKPSYRVTSWSLANGKKPTEEQLGFVNAYIGKRFVRREFGTPIPLGPTEDPINGMIKHRLRLREVRSFSKL